MNLREILELARLGTLEPQQVDEFAIYLDPKDLTVLIIHELAETFRYSRPLRTIESATHLGAIVQGLRNPRRRHPEADGQDGPAG